MSTSNSQASVSSSSQGSSSNDQTIMYAKQEVKVKVKGQDADGGEEQKQERPNKNSIGSVLPVFSISGGGVQDEEKQSRTITNMEINENVLSLWDLQKIHVQYSRKMTTRINDIHDKMRARLYDLESTIDENEARRIRDANISKLDLWMLGLFFSFTFCAKSNAPPKLTASLLGASAVLIGIRSFKMVSGWWKQNPK